MNGHYYRCDRCGDCVNGPCVDHIPAYWVRLKVARDAGDPQFFDLCSVCYERIAAFVRSSALVVTHKDNVKE